MAQKAGIELAVLQLDLDAHRTPDVGREGEGVMHHGGRTRRYLMIIEGDEDILGIAPFDALALPVEQIGVQKIGPGIHIAIGLEFAAATDDIATCRYLHIQPEFVGIGGALSQLMTDVEGADDRLQQITLSRYQGGDIRAQGCMQFTVDIPSRLDAEDIHPGGTAHHALAQIIAGIRHLQQMGYGGIGRREEMAVHAAPAGLVEVPGRRVISCDQWHVAVGAVGHRLLRIVKAVHAVAGDSTQ